MTRAKKAHEEQKEIQCRACVGTGKYSWQRWPHENLYSKTEPCPCCKGTGNQLVSAKIFKKITGEK